MTDVVWRKHHTITEVWHKLIIIRFVIDLFGQLIWRFPTLIGIIIMKTLIDLIQFLASKLHGTLLVDGHF